MANTQAELLGNDIINFIRDNVHGMQPDGWRDLDTAERYIEEFNRSYKDDFSITEYYTAGIPTTAEYRAACKELGVEPRLPERIEYRVVLYPLGAGEWDLTVWVRNHADVEHWKRDIGPDDVENVVFYTRGRHVGRPMAQFELMAVRNLKAATQEYIEDMAGKLQLILDNHMARINNTMTVDALNARRSEGLYA